MSHEKSVTAIAPRADPKVRERPAAAYGAPRKKKLPERDCVSLEATTLKGVLYAYAVVQFLWLQHVSRERAARDIVDYLLCPRQDQSTSETCIPTNIVRTAVRIQGYLCRAGHLWRALHPSCLRRAVP